MENDWTYTHMRFNKDGSADIGAQRTPAPAARKLPTAYDAGVEQYEVQRKISRKKLGSAKKKKRKRGAGKR